MNNLQIFKNNELGEIRIVLKGNEPWFVGKDVAECLGYKNSSKAVSTHVDDEDRILEMIPHSQNGKMVTKTSLINESGLYSLVLSSKLPSAKKFKRWITSEVLPTIRKHGAYMTDDVVEKALTSPDFLIKLATNLKEEKEKRTLAERKVKVLTPKADYFDALVDNNLLTNFRDTAKEFKIKQKVFIQWLEDNNYIYRDCKGKPKPYSQYCPELFELKEFTRNGYSGNQTLITPRGKETFRLLLITDGLIREAC